MERRARRAAGVALAAALLVFGAADSASAGEAVAEENTAPESVEKMKTPLEQGFEGEKKKASLFPGLRQHLQQLPPFFRETSLHLHLRSYAFNRLPTFGDRQAAFAGGGWLAYESGWWAERFSLGATVYTSQRFWGPSRFEGSQLLRPVQRSYSVLGKAFLKLRHESHVLTLGRLGLNLPYVNRRDNRMTPQTFQGATLTRGEGRARYALGYLTDIKLRNSNDFISFSEAAGVGDRARRMFFGGLALVPSESFRIGAVDYFVRDTLNILYAELDWTRDLTDALGVRIGAQFTDQRSVGDDLLTGSSFDTRVFGARASASWRRAVLALSFSTTANEAGIRSPYGSYPGYLSRMQSDFNRAGEEAFGVDLSYHFGSIGFDALSAFGNYTRGWDARDADTGRSLPDRHEWNLTFDWRPKEGRIRGFWLRVRGALAEQDGAEHTGGEFRVILNYEIPVL